MKSHRTTMKAHRAKMI